MNASDFKKLEGLRSDYQIVTGVPFEKFYCPILFRDESGIEGTSQRSEGVSQGRAG